MLEHNLKTNSLFLLLYTSWNEHWARSQNVNFGLFLCHGDPLGDDFEGKNVLGKHWVRVNELYLCVQ